MEDLMPGMLVGNQQQPIPKNNSDQMDDQLIIINNEDDEFIPEYKLKIDEVQMIIERIRDNNQKVLELKQKYQSSASTQAEKDVCNQVNRIIDENTQRQNRLKLLMEEVANDVAESKAKDPDMNEPETRMKVDMQNAVTLKIQNVLRQNQESTQDFKAGLRGKIVRQANLLDQNLNDDQINEICDDPQKMQLLVNKVMFPSQQIMNAVQDIQDKYKDIQKLERSVQQVLQLFTDMAILVKNQGDLIDNIEMNLVKAKEYVAKGEKQLIKAKKDHQEARKKMCCILMIGLSLILIIVFPIISSKL